MNQIQKQFINQCCNKLVDILSDESLLMYAVDCFVQKNSNESRYQIQAISNANEWAENEKIQFSSAFSEAVYQVTISYASMPENFYTDNPEALQDIHNATQYFKTEIIPIITANTEKNARLKSVMTSLIKYQTEELNKADEPIQKSFMNSGLGFFTAAAAAAVVIGTTYALTKK